MSNPVNVTATDCTRAFVETPEVPLFNIDVPPQAMKLIRRLLTVLDDIHGMVARPGMHNGNLEEKIGCTISGVASLSMAKYECPDCGRSMDRCCHCELGKPLPGEQESLDRCLDMMRECQ